LSPSACSYHLRLLAKHGFVEPDDSRDRDGRERVWRAAITSWVSDPDPDADPRQARAVDSTLTRVMLAASDAKVLDFADRAAAEPEWREAALMSNSTVVATVDELREISAGMMAVLRPYFRTTRPLEDAPEGARQVHMSIRMAPEPPAPLTPRSPRALQTRRRGGPVPVRVRSARGGGWGVVVGGLWTFTDSLTS
jgi:hypothetical protein